MKKNRKRKKRSKILPLLGLLVFFSCNQINKNNSTSSDLNLSYHYQISALSPDDVKEFLRQGDTFPIRTVDAYKLLYEEKKIQEILADTPYYKRKLLIGNYPNNNKKVFGIDVREFVDNRGIIIASFSINANTGETFFEAKPFSEAYENGLWEIPIDEWNSKLE